VSFLVEMTSLGHKLEQICSIAERELLLVAPFIKLTTLSQLLHKVKLSVVVKCVTRWRPEEIATGVSDIEVWRLLRDRPNSSLWLKNDLHAKYYRADLHCLVGSANLTQTALGWSSYPNLELLIPAASNNPILQSFEQELTRKMIQVDDDLYEQMKLTVEHFLHSQGSTVAITDDDYYPTQSKDDMDACPVDFDQWIPTLRRPEYLFFAYTGQKNRLTEISWNLAHNDLQVLHIPNYLTKDAFNTYVGALLLQMPIIKHIDEFVRVPQRFGAVVNLLKSLPCANDPEFHAEQSWQTLMRWLCYFLPNRYALSIPNHSEVFYRIDPSYKTLKVAEQGANRYGTQ